MPTRETLAERKPFALPVGFWDGCFQRLHIPLPQQFCMVHRLILQSGPGWGWGMLMTTDLNLKC